MKDTLHTSPTAKRLVNRGLLDRLRVPMDSKKSIQPVGTQATRAKPSSAVPGPGARAVLPLQGVFLKLLIFSCLKIAHLVARLVPTHIQ